MRLRLPLTLFLLSLGCSDGGGGSVTTPALQQTATPSAVVDPTATPTPTGTAAPTPTATAAPTATPGATPTATVGETPTVAPTPTRTPSAEDADNDGYSRPADCDDTDADVNPGADEVCNGEDDDCDGRPDELDPDLTDATTWYPDFDDDGYGDDGAPTLDACDAPSGYTDRGGDCDDDNPAFHPGLVEDDCSDPNDYNCDGSVGFSDVDRDGAPACEDCDDGDAAVHPDATEVCGGVDDDCDQSVDEDAIDTETFYADADNDGAGNPRFTTAACEAPEGWADSSDDCDDTDEAIYPGAEEVCGGVDDDCDGQTDEGAGTLWYADADGDGAGNTRFTLTSCDPPEGWVAGGDDCDDLDAQTYPGATERCDGEDNDCDGLEDEGVDITTYFTDADGDGFGDPATAIVGCGAADDAVTRGGDCDDTNRAVHPNADEVCDGRDNNCDRAIDDADDELTGAPLWYTDADGDTWGDPAASTAACEQPEGAVADAGDCDDDDADVNPDTVWYLDYDQDGYGGTTLSTQACLRPAYHVANADDCDDLDAASHPGAAERCDGEDNNCNGGIDEDASNPPTWYADADNDGFGNRASTKTACSKPQGYVSNDDDCADADNAVYPGAPERCNGADDDCDRSIDEPGDTVQTPWYADTDADGYGVTSSVTYACSKPSGYAAASGDCAPSNAAINPGATEKCDGLDNNCDGIIPADEEEDEDGTLLCAVGCTPLNLPLQSTLTLGSPFGSSNGNFAPQGMDIAHDGNLAIVMQQRNAIDIANITTGAAVSSIPNGLNHNTGVTWDPTRSVYFVSDYTSNNSGIDLYTVTTGGSVAAAASETNGYGGYPLASGDGYLYRTNLSTAYNWSNLTTIRVSTTSNPNAILSTFSPPGIAGIGDMAFDGKGLWLLDYVNYTSTDQAINLTRIDAVTGQVLASYPNVAKSGSSKVPSGLAWKDGYLYVYNWASGGTSTVMKFDARCNR